MKSYIVLVSVAPGLVFFTIGGTAISASAAVTPGAMFDFNAAEFGGDPDRWTNLGTLVGADLINGGGIVLTEGNATNPSYFTSQAVNPALETGTFELVDGSGYSFESFSAEIWARRTGDPYSSGGQIEHQLYSMRDADDIPSANRQRVLIGNIQNTGSNNDDEMDVFLDDPVNARIKVQDFGGPLLPLDEFVQIVHTWDDATQSLSVYQNGVPLDSVNVNDVLPDGGPIHMDDTVVLEELTLFKLHPNENAASRRFNGDISRFRLYDFALSADQVSDNFDVGNAIIPGPGVAGDYSGNGTVDTVDYAVWRDGLGQPSLLNRNPEAIGPVGPGDYEFWRSRYGATSAVGNGSVSVATVPEPATPWLLLLAVGRICLRRRQRARRQVAKRSKREY